MREKTWTSGSVMFAAIPQAAKQVTSSAKGNRIPGWTKGALASGFSCADRRRLAQIVRADHRE